MKCEFQKTANKDTSKGMLQVQYGPNYPKNQSDAYLKSKFHWVSII